ncbi:MAG: LacI family DNA-binding transcriptional regulator [Propionivibrio sp.]
MSVTIRQIAEAAKVSRGTVDKVLNNRPGVSAAVREAILQLANELGYKPNAAGKSLAFQKNPLRIGFLLPTASDPFYVDVEAGIARAAEELAGFGVEVVCRTMAHITVADQLACIREMVQSSLAGLVLSPLDDPAVSDELNRLAANGLRIVTSNSDLPSVNRLCFVGQDLERSGRVAGELVGQLLAGGGQVLVLSGFCRFKAHVERMEGFRAVLDAFHPAVRIARTITDIEDNAMSYREVIAYLDSNPAPDAIFLTGIGTAGVGQALAERGKTGIKFVCYDRIPETQELLKQRIVNFTITQDPFMQGYQPVKVLFDSLFNGTQPAAEHIRTRIEILTAENV